jgi:hypothetical protein
MKDEQMTLNHKFGITLLVALLMTCGSAQAQEPRDEGSVAEQVPEAEIPEASDDYVEVWSVIEEQWEAAQRGDRRWVEEHDTAVAHYLYSNATENRDGETDVSNGRYTDVLVRIDGQWKFIAWHGGDDETGD